MKHTILPLVTIILMVELSWALQDLGLLNNSTANLNGILSSVGSPNSTIPPETSSSSNISKPVSDEEKRFDKFKDSVYYLPCFELELKSLPDVQLNFIRTMAISDMDLLRTILKEAIDKKNSFAPSVSLLFKYSGKLLGNFIRNRQTELRLSQRKDIKPAFFEMLAKMCESIIDKSNLIKGEKGYSKKNVDANELYRRVDNMFKYIQRMLDTSPVGSYLKWDQLILYKNETSNPEHDKNFVEESADLLAVSIILLSQSLQANVLI